MGRILSGVYELLRGFRGPLVHRKTAVRRILPLVRSLTIPCKAELKLRRLSFHIYVGLTARLCREYTGCIRDHCTGSCNPLNEYTKCLGMLTPVGVDNSFLNRAQPNGPDLRRRKLLSSPVQRSRHLLASDAASCCSDFHQNWQRMTNVRGCLQVSEHAFHRDIFPSRCDAWEARLPSEPQ